MFKLVVLSALVALAAAEPNLLGGVWGGHLAAPWAAAVAPVAWAGPVGLGNYRGPLSLAPGQPANIIAADGRPLDTLDVNVDRAAHITAKVLDHGVLGAHLLKKRSVVGAPLIAGPVGWPGVARVVTHGPVVAAAPIGALGWGHGLRWGW